MRNMEDKDLEKLLLADKLDKEYGKTLYEDQITACECGWNGKVDWKAHGQKCPNCGAALT